MPNYVVCYCRDVDQITNVFQSNRRGTLMVNCSLYLLCKVKGKLGGNDVVVCLIEVVEGSERVSRSDKDVSNEISIGSFTKFGSP